MAVQRYRARVISQQSGVNTAGPSNVQDLISLGNQYEATASKVGTRIRADQVKFGNDYGNEILIDDVITLDPETGKPVAFKTSKLTTQAARDAFEDVVQSRFAQGIENQLKLRRTQILEEAKYADDPVSYFNNNFDSYTKERLNKASEGFYANKVSEISGLLKVDGSISANNIQVERNINQLSESLEQQYIENSEDAFSLGQSGGNVSAVLAMNETKSGEFNSLKELNLISTTKQKQMENQLLSSYYSGRLNYILKNFNLDKDYNKPTLNLIQEALIDVNKALAMPSHKEGGSEPFLLRTPSSPLGRNRAYPLKLRQEILNFHEFVDFEERQKVAESIAQALTLGDQSTSPRANKEAGGSGVSTSSTLQQAKINVRILNQERDAFKGLYNNANISSEEFLNGISAKADFGNLSLYSEHYASSDGIGNDGMPDILRRNPADPLDTPIFLPYTQGNAVERKEATDAFNFLKAEQIRFNSWIKDALESGLVQPILIKGTNSIIHAKYTEGEKEGELKWRKLTTQDQVLSFLTQYSEQNPNAIMEVSQADGQKKLIKAKDLIIEALRSGKEANLLDQMKLYSQRIQELDSYLVNTKEKITKETDKVYEEYLSMTNKLIETERTITFDSKITDFVSFINNSTVSFSESKVQFYINEIDKMKDEVTEREFDKKYITKLNKTKDTLVNRHLIASATYTIEEISRRTNQNVDLVSKEVYEAIRSKLIEAPPSSLSGSQKEILQSAVLKSALDKLKIHHSSQEEVAKDIKTNLLTDINTRITDYNADIARKEEYQKLINVLSGDGSIQISDIDTETKKTFLEKHLFEKTENMSKPLELFKEGNEENLNLITSYLLRGGTIPNLEREFKNAMNGGWSNSIQNFDEKLTFYEYLSRFPVQDPSSNVGVITTNLMITSGFNPSTDDWMNSAIILRKVLGNDKYKSELTTLSEIIKNGNERFKTDPSLKKDIDDKMLDLDFASKELVKDYGIYLAGKNEDFREIRDKIDSYLGSVMGESYGAILSSRDNMLKNKSPFSLDIVTKDKKLQQQFLEEYVFGDVLTLDTAVGKLMVVKEKNKEDIYYNIKVGNLYQSVNGEIEESGLVPSSSMLTKEASPETKELLSKIKVKNLFILPIPDITNLYSKMKIETTDADGNNLPPEAVYSQVASPAKFLIMEQIPDTDGELKPFVQFGNTIVFDLKEMNKFLKEQSDEKLEELRLKAEDEALLLKMNQVPKQTTIDPFRASVNPSMPEDF